MSAMNVSWLLAFLFAIAITQCSSQVVPGEVAEVLDLLDQEPQDTANLDTETGSDSGICFDLIDLPHYIRWVTHDRATETTTVAGDDSVLEVIYAMPPIRDDHPSSSEANRDDNLDPIIEFSSYNMSASGRHPNGTQPYITPLNVSVYPGYAMGMLTNEECTAFLVGPRHAITTAECVYNFDAGEWHRDIDMWQARECNTTNVKLLWTSVRIPYEYFIHRNPQHNWAYIEFESTTVSEVWLTIAYDSTLYSRYGPVIIGGYSNMQTPLGCPFAMKCLTKEVRQNSCNLDVACNVPLVFPGSPVVAADYIARRTTTPPVYGVSIRHKTAIRFTKHIFWSICTWMRQSGHDAGCQNEHYFVLDTKPQRMNP